MKELFKRLVSEIVEEAEKSDQEAPSEFTDKAINWNKFFITLALIAGLITVLYQNFAYMLPSKIDKGNVFYYAFMSIVISFMTASESTKLKHTIKIVLQWGFVCLVLMSLFSYRFEIQELGDRIIANLNPSHGVVTGKQSLSFQISSNGHFYVIADVNGQPMRFLVDTGATDIVFSSQMVEKLGYDMNSLSFHQVLNTANGVTRGAPILIDSLQIGPLYLKHLSATVNRAEMNYPLLGMSFFKRLKSYKVEKEVLTLSW